jgi:hypothetical protein
MIAKFKELEALTPPLGAQVSWREPITVVILRSPQSA